MKKMLVSFILGIIVGYGIGLVQMQKELRMQEAQYVNQLQSDYCSQYLQENKDGVCD